jgi:hypothetical protein
MIRTSLAIASTPPVVIISQAMADEYWPDSDPLADRILIGGGEVPSSQPVPNKRLVGDHRAGVLDLIA